MERIKLDQITEKNTVTNTVSLSYFKERFTRLENDAIETVSGGLCGDFDKSEFERKMNELSYFVKNMYVLSDDDYAAFEEKESNDLSDFLSEKLNK